MVTVAASMATIAEPMSGLDPPSHLTLTGEPGAQMPRARFYSSALDRGLGRIERARILSALDAYRARSIIYALDFFERARSIYERRSGGCFQCVRANRARSISRGAQKLMEITEK